MQRRQSNSKQALLPHAGANPSRSVLGAKTLAGSLLITGAGTAVGLCSYLSIGPLANVWSPLGWLLVTVGSGSLSLLVSCISAKRIYNHCRSSSQATQQLEGIDLADDQSSRVKKRARHGDNPRKYGSQYHRMDLDTFQRRLKLRSDTSATSSTSHVASLFQNNKALENALITLNSTTALDFLIRAGARGTGPDLIMGHLGISYRDNEDDISDVENPDSVAPVKKSFNSHCIFYDVSNKDKPIEVDIENLNQLTNLAL